MESHWLVPLSSDLDDCQRNVHPPKNDLSHWIHMITQTWPIQPFVRWEPGKLGLPRSRSEQTRLKKPRRRYCHNWLRNKNLCAAVWNNGGSTAAAVLLISIFLPLSGNKLGRAGDFYRAYPFLYWFSVVDKLARSLAHRSRRNKKFGPRKLDFQSHSPRSKIACFVFKNFSRFIRLREIMYCVTGSQDPSFLQHWCCR